jgi:hypothetical protein
MSSTVDIAQSPLPEGAVEQFSGKWVAIREGAVVAAADSFQELVENEEVRATDVLYHVPAEGTYFF